MYKLTSTTVSPESLSSLLLLLSRADPHDSWVAQPKTLDRTSVHIRWLLFMPLSPTSCPWWSTPGAEGERGSPDEEILAGAIHVPDKECHGPPQSARSQFPLLVRHYIYIFRAFFVCCRRGEMVVCTLYVLLRVDLIWQCWGGGGARSRFLLCVKELCGKGCSVKMAQVKNGTVKMAWVKMTQVKMAQVKK